ncbi:hypothetical protein DV702_04800 [Sporosarcina sp. PTS2304]|uniref:hypothetical protein n=1 Tax=Sporosarcina sp. PTS2304 TaxID=2283194 RepID=UPI000E0D5D18|nr:hypothetical protein [Sporosarcina sp. PTS2304]AXH99113.1 hypothetical protein DV702_04800 [Sporosarcina sp. PTS2304]
MNVFMNQHHHLYKNPSPSKHVNQNISRSDPEVERFHQQLNDSLRKLDELEKRLTNRQSIQWHETTMQLQQMKVYTDEKNQQMKRKLKRQAQSHQLAKRKWYSRVKNIQQAMSQLQKRQKDYVLAIKRLEEQLAVHQQLIADLTQKLNSQSLESIQLENQVLPTPPECEKSNQAPPFKRKRTFINHERTYTINKKFSRRSVRDERE